MELDLRTLRDGHWVRPESPDRIRVTARLHNGVASRTVSDQELQTKGLEAILAELLALVSSYALEGEIKGRVSVVSPSVT